jgi:hypothetical protein
MLLEKLSQQQDLDPRWKKWVGILMQQGRCAGTTSHAKTISAWGREEGQWMMASIACVQGEDVQWKTKEHGTYFNLSIFDVNIIAKFDTWFTVVAIQITLLAFSSPCSCLTPPVP